MVRFTLIATLAALLGGLLLLAATQAQTAKGKKYALLVGVRAYKHRDLVDLKYTENDVEELADSLKGFTEVVVLTSTRGDKNSDKAPTAKNIRTHLKRLLDKVSKHDLILVALAGHGLQLRGKDSKGKEKEEGFFCPSDAKPRTETTLEEQSRTMLGFNELFRELDESGVGVKLLLVDACRNDPKAGRSVTADTMPRPTRGTAALFSCKTGERAFETAKLGKKGHGVFFHFVLEGLQGKARNDKGEVNWSRLAEYVTDNVADTVPTIIGDGAKQTPEEIKKLEGKSPILMEAVRVFAGKPWPKDFTNSIDMKMVRIKPGKFKMGSPADETDRENEEHQHAVEITKLYYLGVYPVTQAEYELVMGSNPSHFSAEGGGKNLVRGMDTRRFPVETVFWRDAVKFCQRLSARPKEKAAGRVYRLPTEAEWEYACRAGTQTMYYSGDSEDDLKRVAWYTGNSRNRTHAVGLVKPNAWGLYDMHGNVWQWCSDFYNPDFFKNSPVKDPENTQKEEGHSLRGGAWYLPAKFSRAARRSWNVSGAYTGFDGFNGFRVACNATRPR